MRRLKALRSLRWFCTALALVSTGVSAGSGAALFGVNIQLNMPAITCSSATQNQLSNVIVRVYCSAGQYVLVQSYAGKQSRWHRYFFSNGPRTGSSTEEDDTLTQLGAGTITEWRSYQTNTVGRSVELLVSF